MFGMMSLAVSLVSLALPLVSLLFQKHYTRYSLLYVYVGHLEFFFIFWGAALSFSSKSFHFELLKPLPKGRKKKKNGGISPAASVGDTDVVSPRDGKVGRHLVSFSCS